MKISIKIVLLLGCLSMQVKATQNQLDLNEQLLIAAESEDFNTAYNNAQVALQAGADINTQNNKYQMTPLHWACAIGRFSTLVELFIDHNASVNSVDSTQLTPLHFACRKRNQAIINLLVLAGATIPEDLQNNLLIQQAKNLLMDERKRKTQG